MAPTDAGQITVMVKHDANLEGATAPGPCQAFTSLHWVYDETCLTSLTSTVYTTVLDSGVTGQA